MSTYNNGTEYAYVRFDDFREKFYWSSQPAYFYNNVVVIRSSGGRFGYYMEDNASFARATSVSYENESGLGPSDPDNYDKESSGMSGCHTLLTMNMSGLVSPKLDSYNFSTITSTTQVTWRDYSENWLGTNVTETLYPMDTKDNPGYLSRDAMARVRCVYKP